MGLYAKIVGYTPAQTVSLEDYCEIICRKAELYGMSGASASMNLRTVGQALGSRIHYPENGMEYIVEHFLKDYSQLEELEQLDVKKNSVLKDIVERGKYFKERFPEMPLSTGVPGPMSAAASVRSIELILRDVKKASGDLHKLLELCVEKCLEWLEYAHGELEFSSGLIFDPVTSTDVLGKKYFQEISKPHFKRLFDGMTDILCKKPTVHICGHTKAIWNDLAEIGVEMFSVDDREEIEDLKKSLGDRMMIIGNVSPVNIIRNGSIDEVIAEVKRQLQVAADSPRGYMIGPGCEIPVSAPKENVDAFLYAIRKYGAGAKIGQLPKGLNL